MIKAICGSVKRAVPHRPSPFPCSLTSHSSAMDVFQLILELFTNADHFLVSLATDYGMLIYAAMFLDSLSSALGGADKLEKCLEEGTWDLVTSWQRKYIWEKGGIYLPKDLIYQVCGRAVTLEPFKKYLEEKYSSLYL